MLFSELAERAGADASEVSSLAHSIGGSKDPNQLEPEHYETLLQRLRTRANLKGKPVTEEVMPDPVAVEQEPAAEYSEQEPAAANDNPYSEEPAPADEPAPAEEPAPAKDTPAEAEAKRGRGRPPGAKNKPKSAEPSINTDTGEAIEPEPAPAPGKAARDKNREQEMEKSLLEPMPTSDIRTRPGAGGKRYEYLSGADVVLEANRIFGPLGWSYVVAACKLNFATAKEETEFNVKKKSWDAGAYAHVEVSVRHDYRETTRSGIGYGTAYRQMDQGAAEELAMKSAETDALKRALSGFGPRLGLALRFKIDEREDEGLVIHDGPPKGEAKPAVIHRPVAPAAKPATTPVNGAKPAAAAPVKPAAAAPVKPAAPAAAKPAAPAAAKPAAPAAAKPAAPAAAKPAAPAAATPKMLMIQELADLDRTGGPVTRDICIRLSKLITDSGGNARDAFSKAGAVPPAMPTVGQCRIILSNVK